MCECHAYDDGSQYTCKCCVSMNEYARERLKALDPAAREALAILTEVADSDLAILPLGMGARVDAAKARLAGVLGCWGAGMTPLSEARRTLRRALDDTDGLPYRVVSLMVKEIRAILAALDADKRLEEAEAALREIEKTEGLWADDAAQFQRNRIDNMQTIARRYFARREGAAVRGEEEKKG